MKTVVIPVVVGALGTVKKGMVENIKKVSERAELNHRFIEQNNKFAGAHAFVYISLPSLHDCDVKMPNFTFYGGF